MPAPPSTAERVLKAVKLGDLTRLVTEWDLPNAAEIVAAKSKAAMVKMLLSDSNPRPLTSDQVAQMDMTVLASKAESRTWYSFQLEYKQGTGSVPLSAMMDRKTLQTALHSELSSFMPSLHTYVENRRDALWVRFGMYSRSQVGHTLYFIYYPQAQVLLSSVVRSEYLAYIQQAFKVALGCSDVRPRDLIGQGLAAMTELTLHSGAQGPYKACVKMELENLEFEI